MKNLSLPFLALALLLTPGCSTIYFHQGNTNNFTRYSEWHHDGILDLVEFSDPVDLAHRCRGLTWSTVKTEKTFIQGLVGAFTFNLYDPWNVAYSCQKLGAPVARPKL